MSTWIESHQDLRSNPKTRRAARALGASVPTVMGHLHCLWHWALDHAEDGDVSPFDAEDLADAAGWEGDAALFVAALTDCGPGEKAGFLEVDGLIGDPEHGKRSPLALHDWWQYAGKLIEKRRKDAERKARARAKDIPPPSEENPEDVQGTSDGQDAEPPRDGAGTEPNRTEPNKTEPKGGTRKRATQIPEGWTPPAGVIADLSRKHPRVDLERELEKFRNHHQAKGSTFKDPAKAFRNWAANAEEWGHTQARGVPSPGSGMMIG